MGWLRMLSFLFLVACVWVGVEVYTQGMDGAFGGALAGLGRGGRSHAESTLERIRESATGARDLQLDRIERQVEKAQ